MGIETATFSIYAKPACFHPVHYGDEIYIRGQIGHDPEMYMGAYGTGRNGDKYNCSCNEEDRTQRQKCVLLPLDPNLKGEEVKYQDKLYITCKPEGDDGETVYLHT